MLSTSKKINIAALSTALICGILIFIVLNVPESVGLANNGDYTRVIYPNNIEFTDGIKYDRYIPAYTMNLSSGSFIQKLSSLLNTDYSIYDYVSSQTLVIKLSKIINVLYNKLTGRPAAAYDLFWLGLIYTVMFVISIFLILRFIYRRLGLKMFVFSSAICLFVFCDQGYILYFNSFYGEALQYVSTFLVIALFLRLSEQNGNGIFSYSAYYAAVGLMAASKNAYAPIGILFSLLPFLFIKKIAFPRKYLISMATFSIALLLLYSSLLTPKWIEDDTNFNSVFSGILKFSDTPEQDLKELGLDPSFSILKGREAYQEDYPIDIYSDEFYDQFFAKTGKMQFVFFYLKHPSRLIKAMDYSANHADYLRARYLGNLQNPSMPQEQSYRFSLWESLRVRVGIYRLWITIIMFLLAFIICIYEIRVKKSNPAFVLLLLAIMLSAAYNFAIPYIGNGICDIAKHMFGFIYLYDLIFFILLGYLVNKLPVNVPSSTALSL